MKTLKRILDALSRMELTIVCMVAAMVLVFTGTIAQVHLGTYAAQKKFFDSFWIIWATPSGLKLPVFPGGLTLGALWAVNLAATYLYRHRFDRRKIGTYVTHLGIWTLLVGQFLTQALARESQMAIEEGQTVSYSESAREVELAVVDPSSPDYDRVVSVPPRRFERPGTIDTPVLPFKILVHRFYPNARLMMRPADSPEPPPATQGIGASLHVEEAPPSASDDDVNNASVLIEVEDRQGQSHGTWFLSTALGGPQPVSIDGKNYLLSLRPMRNYVPFSVTLKDFRHDVYPGTDIPKNFSSLVHLSDPSRNESRDVLIYMNHPLRYAGRTFYQASFGKGDTLSVLQVVENPVWRSPYAACILVATGLSIQFLTSLAAFLRRRKTR